MARCYDSFGRAYYCRNRSTWNSWGRWVALVVILVAAFLFFFLLSCLTARRRRKRGLQPFRGTGWTAAPFGHGPAQYNPNYQEQQQPQHNQQSPPGYGQNGGYYGGQNQGYFGGQQTGTELQPPQNAYRGGDNVYQPPTGPPPKGDNIVR